jgi:hypothetical protein
LYAVKQKALAGHSGTLMLNKGSTKNNSSAGAGSQNSSARKNSAFDIVQTTDVMKARQTRVLSDVAGSTIPKLDQMLFGATAD